MAFPLGTEIVIGTTAVGGDVASGAVDSGKPVKVGGVNFFGVGTGISPGQRSDMALGSDGGQPEATRPIRVMLFSAGGLAFNAISGVPDTDVGVRSLAVSPVLFNGVTWDRQRTPAVFKVVAAVAVVAGVGATIWTPAAGKKFRLMGYSFSSSAAASLIFGDNVVGTVIFRGPLLGLGGIDEQNALGNGILSAAANNVLKLDVSSAATISGTVWGCEE